MTQIRRLTLAALVSATALTGWGQTVLQEDFSQGIPAGFTNIDYDGMNVQTSCFKAGSPTNEWFSVLPGRDDYYHDKAAYSCSLRQYDTVPTDNWLITPQLTLDGDDLWLAWDAHSVHRFLPESYEVKVSTTGTNPDDFETVYSTDAEPYRWTHHLVSLAAYKGKQVYVAFVHTSTARYLLAIDNLFVGKPGTTAFTANDQTLHSCGDTGTTPVTGTYRNDGAAVSLASIDCTLGDGTRLTATPAAGTLATGAEGTFSFDVPVTLNSATRYKVEAVAADGRRYTLASDSVWCTAYPRVIMMDKVSTYWCTNCPDMDLFNYDLEDRLGSQFVEVNVQGPAISGSDPGNVTYENYLKNLPVVNYPTAFYNRVKSAPQYSPDQTGPLIDAIRRPCNVGLTSVSATLSDGQITAKVSAEWATALDNSKDKYRIGFALLEDTPVLPPKMTQYSNLTLPQNNEFYFLPTKIPQPVVRFPNLVRGTDVAFSGVEQSFPAAIEARKPYEVSYTFAVPERVTDPRPENLRVVAFVLNTASGEALNASVMRVTQPTGIVEATSASQAAATCRMDEAGLCTVSFAPGVNGTVNVYSLAGTRLAQSAAAANVHTLDLASLPAGCYLVEMTSPEGRTTAKVVKR